jgi:drug/metabolite transporter (DMT)-like permease
VRRIPAPLLSLTAVVSWGAMFPIAAHALPHVDAFNLTAIRYGLASLAFVALLVVAEGRGALRYDGRFGELFVLGSFARATLAFMGLALAGVVLVITHGAPGSLVDGGIGGGEALVLLGVIGWVLYTTGVARFPAHSPLRYTTLSAVAGTLTILAVTAVADVAGLQHLPGGSDLRAAAAPLAFIVVFGAVVAVIAYNAGVRRLGAANGALFMNLVPVTTFVIAIAGGTRPGAAELAGALLTIAALVGANVATRRAASTTTAAARERPVPALP